MSKYNKGALDRIAKEHGFVRDTFEKVLRLKEILLFLNTDDYLKKHLVLKGGTAINLLIFNLPRLSVDIDLDFMPSISKEETNNEREKITKIVKSYMEQEGYCLSEASRYSHSLDAFMFQYENAAGNYDNIKVEINYSLRAHLFSPIVAEIIPSIFADGVGICMLEPLEIFAAKTNALMSRATARDLYDFNNMVRLDIFDGDKQELLRKSIVFYASISAQKINKNFDTSAINRIDFSKIRRDLLPVLREAGEFDLEERKREARDFINNLMVLTAEENEYLRCFELGEYKPELLFENNVILENIKEHPMALWKTQNYKI